MRNKLKDASKKKLTPFGKNVSHGSGGGGGYGDGRKIREEEKRTRRKGGRDRGAEESLSFYRDPSATPSRIYAFSSRYDRSPRRRRCAHADKNIKKRC